VDHKRGQLHTWLKAIPQGGPLSRGQANDIGVLLATTTSSNKDAFRPGTSGVYSFQNLAPGTYTVSVTAPDGKVTSGASTLTESVTSGAVLSAQNFGVKNNPPTVSLSGTIFGDADGNGL
jgi:hypothetical protein